MEGRHALIDQIAIAESSVHPQIRPACKVPKINPVLAVVDLEANSPDSLDGERKCLRTDAGLEALLVNLRAVRQDPEDDAGLRPCRVVEPDDGRLGPGTRLKVELER